MIQIICCAETYIYNTYHMTKAFYPSEEVISQIEEKASNYVMVKFEEQRGPSASCEEISVTDQQIEKYFNSESFKGKENTDPKELKYRIDITLYHLLKEKTGRELAWGILMGVRPTKIAMQKLSEGMEETEFVNWYREEFLVSRQKAELAVRIAKREKALIDQLDLLNGYSLYVGIPFCPTVCSYCSFSSGSLSDWKHRVEDYVDALCKELRFIAKVSGEKKLNTIYIGGGTPTTLSEEQLERVLSCIDEHFSKEYLLEYTVEAGRPDSITEGKLRVIKNHGVTRISINPQTMQQKTLDLVGRKHTVEDIKAAYEMARNIGFDNINMDLIAGLPGETLKDMEDSLRQIEALAPDNLTVHALAIKRAAKMGQKHSREYEEALAERKGAKGEHCVIGDMIDAAYDAAERMNLAPYYLYRQKNIAGNFENVGYAKVDKAGIYNILIMEEKQSIVAAGAGASTKIVMKEAVPVPGSKSNKKTHLMRIENVKAIDAYIDRIDEMIERKGEWLWH